MTEITPAIDTLDWNEKEKKLPGMLNVLTILTMVGCGLGLIAGIYLFTGAQKAYDKAVDMQGKTVAVPVILIGPDPVGMARKTLENRTPILLSGLIGMALCLYGAIQMRKRKKAGFSVYLVGQILPAFLNIFIFVGGRYYTSFTLSFALVFPILFIILYTTQLKHLVQKR
jgi:hypothetical protein